MGGDEGAAPAWANLRLGPYDLVRCLGRGGMADVFEARHVELGKRVAVKILRSPLGRVAADSEAMRRVLREGRAATAVHHPNVVAMLDVGFQDGIAYLVMEVRDTPLAKRPARAAPVAPRATFERGTGNIPIVE
jgi:serine/threonine protein kinase